MKSSNLPDAGDREAIFVFAMTFNGYEHFGSLEACAEAAASGDRSTIELPRNELFFADRASRHLGDDDFINLYAELIPEFELQLAKSRVKRNLS